MKVEPLCSPDHIYPPDNLVLLHQNEYARRSRWNLWSSTADRKRDQRRDKPSASHSLEDRKCSNHPSLLLSCRSDFINQHQSALISQGYQCQVVNYDDPSSLQHALMGIDTVISTVTGDSQLRLIEAAVQCRVRRFAPAEFEGQPGLRSQNPVLDRGKSAALSLLRYYQGHIQYTYGTLFCLQYWLLTVIVFLYAAYCTRGSR
jgi:hypothetical protein